MINRGLFENAENSIRHAVKETTKEAQVSFEQRVLTIMVKKYGKTLAEHGWDAIPGVMGQYLDWLKIEPEFVQSTEPQFPEWRHRLNTEAGIVIANHPAGHVDAPLLLSIITNPRTAIFVQERIYEAVTKGFGKYFGEEAAVEAKKHLLSNGRHEFERALEHVENGGLLVMHPTAGTDGGKQFPTKFASGLGAFIERLKPETMIYAFHFEFDDYANFHNKSTKFWEQMAKASVSSLIPTSMDSVYVKAEERYTQVADWHVETGNRNVETNNSLVIQYKNLFETNIL